MPLSMSFELARRSFTLGWEPDAAISAPTEIFVPRFQYPKGFDVALSSGTFAFDESDQVLKVSGVMDRKVTVTITPR